MDRLAAIETFISVIEAGSFSGGARRLRIGQPAVSKSIAALEARLGVRLLMRSTRGLTPTEAGQRFYEAAKRAVELADEAEVAARGSGAALSGKIRVCAAVTFARLYIIPAIESLMRRHPELKLEIILDDRNIDLLEEGIDVALRMGTLDDSGMTAGRLGECPRLVVGTPGYFERAGVPRAPHELQAHDAIVYGSRGTEESWTFRRDGAAIDVAISGRMSVSAAEGVRAAVLAGLGLAVGSEWMFASELKSGAVIAVLEDWALPPVGLWAVYPTGRMVSAKTRAFVEFVRETLASLA